MWCTALFPGRKFGKLPPVTLLTTTKSGFKPQTNAVISIKLLPTHYATPNFHAIITICNPERRFERNNKLTKGQASAREKFRLFKFLDPYFIIHPSGRKKSDTERGKLNIRVHQMLDYFFIQQSSNNVLEQLLAFSVWFLFAFLLRDWCGKASDEQKHFASLLNFEGDPPVL